MKSLVPTGMALALTLCLVASTVLAGSGEATTLSGGDYELSGRLTSDVDALAVSDETWGLGFPWEGDLSSAIVAAQVASDVAAFRSAEAVNAYYVLPAAATAAAVHSARFCILRRTGAYSGDAVMSLEVIGADGGVRHTVSRSSVNVASAPTGVWTSMALREFTSDDVQVASGERLAFHCGLGAGTGGDLDVRTAFEVEIRSGSVEHLLFLRLPILGREYTY